MTDLTLEQVFCQCLEVAEAQGELTEHDLERLRGLLRTGVDTCEIDSELAPWFAERINALDPSHG
ncbi:hypothetical protein GFS31_41710 (plasmid) [Leptolyngbya sp. BL0902]|uniref:hypothetical protein n=1 Tax=Leptolyngbya sp. BL0902 TaxID=1115757 RepID=UPI0018E75781|nr:hypothetical protein [Leptolyngbya sp. BL0902]QQE67458.1 hypothetical protein GFS31_41710 [Leptolyngbya sp. BL0902]